MYLIANASAVAVEMSVIVWTSEIENIEQTRDLYT